ncbi:hypothetical protein VKT23_009068 [Stygiomarasmius scandens]|uniref:Uncharacterized protein n=1 Tax=Marasmiellus scandens TaxID=2682957 RepID=A0ABR1JLN6_9AGAR
MTNKKQPEDKGTPGRPPWHHDEKDARLNWLKKQIPERQKCANSKTVGQFLTVTTTHFMGKFGFYEEKLGVAIPAVPDYEDPTPGATIKYEPQMSSDVQQNKKKTSGPNKSTMTTVPSQTPTVPSQTAPSAISAAPVSSTPPSKTLNVPAVTEQANGQQATSSVIQRSDESMSGTGGIPMPAGSTQGEAVPEPSIAMPAGQSHQSGVGEKPKSPAVGEADSSSVDANAHGTVTTTVAADSATATSSAPSPFGTTSMSLNEPESAAVAVPNPSSTTQPASNPAATSTSAPPRGHQSFSIGSIKGIDDEGLQSAAEVLGWMELTAEEIQIRRTGFQNLRGKLQTWFATQVRKVGETGSALITKMAKASGRVAPKPQRMHDVQMFIRVYYNNYIKEALQIEMERLQEEFQQWRTANPNASNEDVKKKKPV